MATQTDEIQDIDQVLETLEQVDGELDEPQGGQQDSAPGEQVPEAEEFVVPEPQSSTEKEGDLPRPMMALLNTGIAQMAAMEKVREFPEFFLRLAQTTGLRLILLKRWTSGLQAFMEENIQLPVEAKKKRRDGRAPIPSTDTDIFQAITEDATIYAGPVPVKFFPLDLTLMLGRGSRDRKIIILPLPSQNHWNTFLYLDADKGTEKYLAVAEVLARFALTRLCLLNKDDRKTGQKVAEILKAEQKRRLEDPSVETSGPGVISPEEIPEKEAHQEPVIEVPPSEAPTDTSQGEPEHGELSTPAASPMEHGNLTPEAILHHSGELPALPKAACHIMAVIEDPGTTATKLEQALAMDQALTAKVLRIANSPFYGAVREITTVSEAIVRLGFVSIRNWTLVTAARSVFLTPGAGMLYQKIWRQSVMSAMAGQLVAHSMGRSNPDSVFIGGLMQNIGQLVLARSHPELFQEILNESTELSLPYHVVERGRLGFDHGELGALLIQEWNLSQDLEEAVRWHHRFDHDSAQSQRTAAMIALGEEIALCTSGQDDVADDEASADLPEASSEPDDLSEAALFLGVTAETLADLKEKAAELKIDPHFFS